LLFEVSLFFAPKDIAFKYINKQLTPILSKYGSIEEINTDIDGSLTKLDALDAKVQDSKSNVLKLKVEISEAYKVSKECNGEVQKTLVNATKVKDLTVISKDSSSKIEENISKANASSSLLTSSLDKVHDSLSKLNQSKDIESVGKKSEELQNRIDNISKSVKKTLKELSSLFKNLELDNDQKK
jgi:methyl-accepting chemotaxis protein